MILVSSSEKIITFSAIIESTLSLFHLQPFFGGEITFPDGVNILYVRFGLGLGDETFPENQGPLESLSGFL